MDDKKIESLLLKLIEDMAVVKNKLELLEDIKEEQKEVLKKVDKLEDKVANHKARADSIEKRVDKIEGYLEDKAISAEKNRKSIVVSVFVCIITSCINIIFSLFTK